MIYVFFILAFVLKFNSLVQSIFFNTIYQTSYPSITNTSNVIPYEWTDKYWKPLPFEKNITQKKAKIHGYIDDYPLEIYNNSSIVFPKLMNYYTCYTNPGYSFIIGNSYYPIHHQWFELQNFNPKQTILKDFECVDKAIAVPFTENLSSPSYIINVFSLLFSLNSTMIHQYPIVLGYKFDYLEEVLNLTGLNDIEINYPNCTDGKCYNTIYISNAFFVSVPNPYEVASEPIRRMVEIMKPAIQEYATKDKPIIISTEGDKRITGKNKLYEHLSDTFNDQVENLISDENLTFTDYASQFIYAKVAISFSSEMMSLIPFMEPGSLFIEIQDSRIISRNVLLAQSFGLDVHVFPTSKYNITESMINKITKLIKKRIKPSGDHD